MPESLYAAFAVPNFDANEYANAILAGEPFPPPPPVTSGDSSQTHAGKVTKVAPTSSEPAKEDISVAISKLTLGIDDVSKQLKNVVTNNHETLLIQAAGVGALEDKLQTVKSGLEEVSASQDKLRTKIRTPCTALGVYASRLARLQCAADALRRTARFVVLARRLESQMTELSRLSTEDGSDPVSARDGKDAKRNVGGSGESRRRDSEARISVSERRPSEDHLSLGSESDKERAIAKAALTVAELVALLDAPPDEGRPSNALEQGIGAETTTQSPLDEDFEVTEIPLRSIHAVTGYIPAIESARTKISSEMEIMVLTGLGSLNRSLLASSLQTAHNLRVLPNLVQSLLADLTDAVEQRIKLAFDISRISKELNAKEQTSTASGLLYRSRVRTEPTNVTAPQFGAALWTRLEALIGELADCCIKVYTLEKVLQLKKDTVTQTNFMDEAMKVLENKPSSTFWTVLARTLEKQCKDASRNSTFMQQTLSSGYPRLLRLFHEFFAKIAVHTDTIYTQDKQSPETILILRALSVFEQSYLQRSANRLNEVVAQSVAGGARAPPAMGEGLGIARAAANELDAAKFDPLLIKAVAKNVQSSLELLLTRLDPLIVRDRWATSLLGPVSTPQQTQNAQVATCLYHCATRFNSLEGEYSESVIAILQPSVRELHRTYDRIVEPLLSAIRRELSAILAKMHKLDLGAPDASAGMGGPSTYMKDLVEKLNFVKTEVLAKFNVGDASREWVATIAKNVVRSFVLNASIANPLGEGGKLQLTSDMTELEFALSAFMADGGSQRAVRLDVIGDDYRALRAMRTSGLPPLVVLHHILVRSPLPLPHSLHGWSEAEYVRWVEEHTEEEALTLIDGVLIHWEKINEPGSESIIDQDPEKAKEFVQLAISDETGGLEDKVVCLLGMMDGHRIRSSDAPQVFSPSNRPIFNQDQVIGGHVCLPLLIATLVLTRAVTRRHPALVNLLVLWMAYATACLILLYSGEQSKREPSYAVCLAQASMIYGSITGGEIATLCLVLQLWMEFQFRGQTFYKHSKLSTILLLLAPWTVFLFFMILALIIGLKDPSIVTNKWVFYCTVSSNFIAEYTLLVRCAW
ncbi:uncharacterized protein FOMMEDRAFT_146834 [Fomitiporia mediterranea MF3/22]|uniref:uncharacterized protein n=1 Tax=Fomitiporia mediterranea (strain MF3/22) TaxID=694068 RepID=UPI00044092D4|nr:uncharacterized protein FOMMEDRAFT_146834 [Fomitiporia mediterranea MF3/22]EJD03176.1 hypothetical protein FOMMEDRAFT_146834 [Fomitiporia mediterranea MF3/22]